jgi:cysteinyl-tRNA synthetase
MVYLTYDLLIRRLKDQRQEVVHVRNITDVGDSFSRVRARASGGLFIARGSGRSTIRVRDGQLNMSAPNLEPRATRSIDGTVQLIQKLTAGGFTYVLDGDIYF